MARMEKFRIQSAGTAYDLEIGFVPDTIEVWNYTKWATDATKVKFYWHRGMTDAYDLSELCEDTSTNHAIDASNGFTVASTMSVTSNRQTVSGITQANPGVVTVSSTADMTSSDKIRFRDIGGMVELNDNLYEVVVIDGTTFRMLDAAGDDIDTTGYTTFAAGSALNYVFDVSAVVSNSGTYRVTLGTTVVGANDDILFVECRQADNYENKGDVA